MINKTTYQWISKAYQNSTLAPQKFKATTIILKQKKDQVQELLIHNGASL